MSINSEIERISGNVSDALAATAEMGANVPATASSDNLGTLIRAIPRVNVVQSTGSSTSDVMSQAAVTNALNDQKAFYVNMVDAESDDSGTLMVQGDKTYEQVVEAYAAGMSVYVRYISEDSTFILPLMGIADGLAMFLMYIGSESLIITMGDGMGNYGVLEIISVDEQLGVSNHISDTRNPHNVTATQVGAPTVAEMNAAVNAAKYTHPASHPASMITGLATVATSGSYNDLTNKPTIPSTSGLATTASLTAHTGDTTVHITAAERTAWNAKSNFSGSYNDLTNKPTIPAAVTVDSALSSSSTNPVQNKVVNSALSGKAPAYTYGTTDLTAGTSSLATGVLYFVYE